MPYASDKFNTFYSLKKINDKNPILFVQGVGLTNQMWYPQVDFIKNYILQPFKIKTYID